MRILFAASLLAASLPLASCDFFRNLTGTQQVAPKEVKPLAVKSFSETTAVTAIQPVGGNLYVGTAHGLIKWDIAKVTSTTLTAATGLPGDKIGALANDLHNGVWVMTDKGVSHESKGAWQNAPAVPVGAFVAGMVVTDDGSVWAGGPEGLARLNKGTWTHYLGDTTVTALEAAGNGNDVWVGTSGKGVARVRGEQVELYGTEQGCEADIVRGLAATPSGVMAIGEGAGGGRLAFFDGHRFFSYKVDAPKGTVFEWIRRVGDHVLIGSGSTVWSIVRLTASDNGQSTSPIKAVYSEGKAPKPPLVGPARSSLPTGSAAEPPPPTPKEAGKDDPNAPPPTPKEAAKTDPKKGDAKGDAKKPDDKKTDDKKTDTKTAAKDTKPAPAPTPPPPPKPADEPQLPAPIWAINKWGPVLPDGVTTVGTDGVTLFVGTRFLGGSRVDETGLTHFRTYDLAKDAERLSVACESESDCYVATGVERAWHFDGQSFGKADIDPEEGSRILAVLNPPRRGGGSVLAIHRGAKDPLLRLSTVNREGTWTPISATEVQVPQGAPDVTFAMFAPTGHLWLGLRYIDKDGDKNDYGAAEVDLDTGQVVYHRQSKGLGPRSKQLPNDLEAAFFVDNGEAWFGSRSGAVHVKADSLQIFTENDGLESEYIHDVTQGTDGQIWVATGHGVGRYDGTRWSFPHDGDYLKVKATSFAKDNLGTVFVGSTTGVVATTTAKTEKFDTEKGLLDNSALDLAVDKRGRVWVLTEKGISILDR
jgi:hypothetical protein